MIIVGNFQMPLLLVQKVTDCKLCSSHFGVNHGGLNDKSPTCDDTTAI